MKKVIALLLVLMMVMALLASCDSKDNGTPQDTQSEAPSVSKPKEEEEEEAFDINSFLPEYLNYNNREVVLCVRGGCSWEIGLDGEDTEPLSAELYDRTSRTEERLGIVLAVDEIEAWDNYNNGIAKIRNKIGMNEHAWDIVVGWSPRIPQIAAEGLYYNLLNFDYFDASQVWWSQSLAKELTVNSRMFLASGDVSTNYLLGAHVVFFNRTLAKAMDMDYSTFYKTVSEGKWTFDELYNLSKDAYSDLNGNTKIDSGDQFGLLIISTKL